MLRATITDESLTLKAEPVPDIVVKEVSVVKMGKYVMKPIKAKFAMMFTPVCSGAKTRGLKFKGMKTTAIMGKAHIKED